MIDHGGNLDDAIKNFGGNFEDWIDLSTGINPVAYPVLEIPEHTFTDLPRRRDLDDLINIARKYYKNTEQPITAVAGAQTAIQQLPLLFSRKGTLKVLSPTYNEYENVFSNAGWNTEKIHMPEDLKGADCAVVVNPNNPTGKLVPPEELISLARNVECLVIDESFMDTVEDSSIAELTEQDNILILRSFGKFFGLAGIRLGFAIGSERYISALKQLNGPWPVSGLAIHIGKTALADRDWVKQSIHRLDKGRDKLDQLCTGVGWNLIGGTSLFRLYEVDNAGAAQERLAESYIWSRIFPWSDTWIRLGLPGLQNEWKRFENALNI